MAKPSRARRRAAHSCSMRALRSATSLSMGFPFLSVSRRGGQKNYRTPRHSFLKSFQAHSLAPRSCPLVGLVPPAVGMRPRHVFRECQDVERVLSPIMLTALLAGVVQSPIAPFVVCLAPIRILRSPAGVDTTGPPDARAPRPRIQQQSALPGVAHPSYARLLDAPIPRREARLRLVRSGLLARHAPAPIGSRVDWAFLWRASPGALSTTAGGDHLPRGPLPSAARDNSMCSCEHEPGQNAQTAYRTAACGWHGRSLDRCAAACVCHERWYRRAPDRAAPRLPPGLRPQ